MASNNNNYNFNYNVNNYSNNIVNINNDITSLNLTNQNNKDYSNQPAMGGGQATPPGFYEKHPELLNKPLPRTDGPGYYGK